MRVDPAGMTVLEASTVMMSTMLVTVEERLMAIFFVVLTVGFSLTVRTRYRMLLRLSKSFWTFFNFFQGKEEGFWLDWVTHNLINYTFTLQHTQWRACPDQFHS